jgi:hypothetical protein
VREVLVVELDLSLRHFRLQRGALVEDAAGLQGWVQLDSLPVRLRRDEVVALLMVGPFGETTLR